MHSVEAPSASLTGRFVPAADLLLVAITLIWGTTFTIVHAVVVDIPPMMLVALRFGCASLALLPLVGGARRLGVRGVGVGIALGAILFAGFATQTLGLQRTTPGRAGFITGLNVIMVPVFGFFLGHRLPMRAVVGVVLAVAGLAILSWGCQLRWLGCTPAAVAESGWSFGDTLVLLCAVAFALHIVGVGRWAGGLEVGALNAVQLFTVTALAVGVTLLSSGPPTGGFSGEVWAAGLFLGLVATALVFWLQLLAQRTASPTRTALIFALEPVFAALFARLWIGEAVTPAVWLGGCLMLTGILVSETPRRNRAAARPPS